MRLRVHLTLLVIATLVPMVFLSAVSLNKLQEAHREAALASLHETARAASLVIDRELTGVQSALRVLAASDALDRADYQRFHEKARQAIQPSQGWIILFGEDGRQLINTRIPYGTPLPGRRVNLERFPQIQSEEGFHVSDLTWGEHARRHVVMVEMPVTIDGQRLVLSQAILPAYFNRTFAERNIPDSWVVAVFDKSGNTLARSHRPDEYVGKKALAATLDAIRTGYTGVMRHKIRGEVEVYDVFVHSPLSQWTVALGAPVKEIDGAISQAVIISGAGLLSAILAASLVAFVVGRRISRAVQGAVRNAVILGKGGSLQGDASSGVAEIDVLQATLLESGRLLDQEKAHRQAAEAERNALLESEQQARRQAEQQNRAKDQFLAMLGHELRNPLAAMTSAVEVLGMEGNPERAARARAILRRQGEHLNHIVDDLLDVSRVLSGKVLLDKQPLDLAATAAGCLATLRSTGRTDRHAVTLSALRPVWINADATRIEQIINNLLDNAVKYTPAGGAVRIAVHAEETEAVLSVEDTGIGVPPELQAAIFDVFVQGERSLDRAQGGLGIGLALVRELARLHEGTVECRSAGARAGSMFILRLPLSLAPAACGSESPSAEPEPRSVLLIDDHADAREMTFAMLASQGHRVQAAAGAEEGMMLALADKPDVALVDIGLPGMDGYALARAMRTKSALAGVTLVALTGYGSDEDRLRSQQAGFDLHIVKPLTRQKFEQVSALLDRQASAR
ncbi:MAG TPA: ATP-binding protein [Noviherbaspirillum sp.]|jgi:signal transduction histidine kinase/CheY-like chemotaxis protein|uniref:ATP-binding protein n=1 Tax=Noviherbaspirillum sp. TaxID=1926288 RepID=UPI002F927A95